MRIQEEIWREPDANYCDYRPEKPLKWLSEFLAEKSKEVEGP